jgi:hypothetical protein
MDTPKIGLSRLIKTVPASFSSFYLTLVCLIQGVALGLLATKIPDFLSTFNLIGLFYALLTFIVVVVVWHEYVLAAQEFWWEITWWDSIIPFLLGMGEYLMIEYIGKGPHYNGWFFAATFTAFAGFLAYVNYDRWIKEPDFENPAAFALFQSEVARGRWLMFALALDNLASGVLLIFWSGRILVTVLGVIYGLFLFLIIRKRLTWQKKAMVMYGWHQ